MSRHGRIAALIGLASALTALALAGSVLTTTAWASTPASTATCTGTLTPDSSGASQGEPNLLDYSFSCSASITTYTFSVTRANEANTIDNFEPSPVVYDTTDTPSTTESFACSGQIPGDGFNCNAPTGTPMTADYTAQGSLDPVESYCKHLPVGAKPGTPAIPQAQVQVIVTDTGGGSDGPFPLTLTTNCPSVPNTVPYPTPPKPKPVHSCSGKLSRDTAPTSSEPNLLGYRFTCDGTVTAYTLIVARQSGQTDTINAFKRNPLVLEPGGAPSPSQGFSCAGSLPGRGFDCTDTDGQMTAGNAAYGSFNPIQSYCQSSSSSGKHADSQSEVELLVSDATGALRGPFELGLAHACAAASHNVHHKNKNKKH